MATLPLQLTSAGLAAIAAASGTEETIIAHLGLTQQPFVAAPTLTALPGEFKRISIISGEKTAPNVVHVTAYDTSADVWSATGFGLFLEDGTLFAASSSAQVVISKAGVAFALMAFDIAINADLAAQIEFGDASFVWPPATEQVRGIARIATTAEADAGTDDATIVTPSKVKRLWDALRTSLLAAIANERDSRIDTDAALNTAIGTEATTRQTADTALGGRIDAEIAARQGGDTALGGRIDAEVTARQGGDTALGGRIDTLSGRTVTGGGLATGGGDLTANRTITVTEASAAEITAGTAADKVVTPRRLGPISMSLQQNGFIRFFGFQIAWGRFNADPNGTTAVPFAQSFPNACFSVVVSGVVNGGPGSQDNTPAVVASTIDRFGFSVFSADDETDVTCYIAVGN